MQETALSIDRRRFGGPSFSISPPVGCSVPATQPRRYFFVFIMVSGGKQTVGKEEADSGDDKEGKGVPAKGAASRGIEGGHRLGVGDNDSVPFNYASPVGDDVPAPEPANCRGVGFPGVQIPATPFRRFEGLNIVHPHGVPEDSQPEVSQAWGMVAFSNTGASRRVSSSSERRAVRMRFSAGASTSGKARRKALIEGDGAGIEFRLWWWWF